MSEIEVTDVTVDGTTIRCRTRCSRDLRRFFSGEEFVADYDVPVEIVPESIAVIPVLAHVCPVAWANGAEVYAPAVDTEFLDALRSVGRSLVDMYPTFMRGGTVQADEAVTNDPPGGDSTAMLFSGGVDSMATYVRHREEDPSLISIQGWVIKRDQPERWNRVKEQVEAFAEPRGLDNRFLSSNMLQFLDTPMLQAHYKRYVTGAWYSSVGQGLGMLGLCAPLAYREGFSRLYMAATHTEEVDEPWGSHPSIDDQVQWSGTTAVHDGYDMTRQEKIELLADYIRDGNPQLRLRTCINSEVGENCSSCEKCYRTSVGLLLAGLDPNDHGYDVDPSMFVDVREAFENCDYALSEGHQHNWEEFRAYAGSDRRYPWPEVDEFLEWLRTVDLEAVVERSNPSLAGRLVRAGARHTPYPVYALAYPVYSRLKPRGRT